MAKVIERNHRPLSKLHYVVSRWHDDIHTSPHSSLEYIMISYFLIFEEADKENQEGDCEFNLLKIPRRHHHSWKWLQNYMKSYSSWVLKSKLLSVTLGEHRRKITLRTRQWISFQGLVNSVTQWTEHGLWNQKVVGLSSTTFQLHNLA